MLLAFTYFWYAISIVQHSRIGEYYINITVRACYSKCDSCHSIWYLWPRKMKIAVLYLDIAVVSGVESVASTYFNILICKYLKHRSLVIWFAISIELQLCRIGQFNKHLCLRFLQLMLFVSLRSVFVSTKSKCCCFALGHCRCLGDPLQVPIISKL